MEFCPHCMQPSEGSFCGNCGKPMDVAAAPGQLPLGTILRSIDGRSYQLGAALRHGEKGITYAAMDLKNGRRVKIREFFPGAYAFRLDDHSVAPLSGQEDAFNAEMEIFYRKAARLEAESASLGMFEENGTAYVVLEMNDGAAVKPPAGSAKATRASGAVSASQKSKKWGNDTMKKLIAVAAAAVLLVLATIVGCSMCSEDEQPQEDTSVETGNFGDIFPNEETEKEQLFNASEEFTSENFKYIRSEDGQACAIIGYVGTLPEELTIPSMLDGYRVSTIKRNAFDNQTSLVSVTLGAITVEDQAFIGCTGLRSVTTQNTVFHATPFAGCTELLAGLYTGTDPFESLVMDNEQFKAYPSNVEDVDGLLKKIGIVNNVVYASTDTEAVVLRVLNASEIVIEEQYNGVPVTWICAGALDNVRTDANIRLPDETCYHMSLHRAVNWSPTGDTLAQCWKRSCDVAEEINTRRGANAPQIEPDVDLIRAAMAHAKELPGNSEPQKRANGSDWTTILQEHGVVCDYANFISAEDPSASFTEPWNAVYEHCAKPETAPTVAGRYYDKVAVGTYPVSNENGLTVYMVTMVIMSPQ